MRRNKIKLFWLIGPFLFWLALIYFFSSQPYQDQALSPWLRTVLPESTSSSYLSWISFEYGGVEISVDSLGLVYFTEFFIRKGAHFFIFGILGILTVRILLLRIRSKFLSVILGIGFVFLYAALDEFHQHFTVSRSPLFSDVLIDCSGGILGILLYLPLYKGR